LRNVIERAVLMTAGEFILAGDLIIDRRSQRNLVGSVSSVRIDPDGRISVIFSPQGLDLEKAEQELIRAALQHTQENITQAAALLHMSRDTLRYRIAKYGLDQEDTESAQA